MLNLQPITFAEAKAFVQQHHRHHGPPIGYKLCAAVNDGELVVGVAIAGRPVARGLDDAYTLEISRCCTDGTPNAPSMLYRAIARAARALGYRRVVTYTLASEPGTSLRAAGFRVLWQTKGGQWSRPSRPRVETAHPEQKLLWEAVYGARRAEEVTRG